MLQTNEIDVRSCIFYLQISTVGYNGVYNLFPPSVEVRLHNFYYFYKIFRIQARTSKAFGTIDRSVRNVYS